MESQLIIDNQARGARQGRTFERRNPLSGDVVTTGAAASVDDALDAVESASAAFTEWSQTGPTQRRAVMLKAADLIEARRVCPGRRAERRCGSAAFSARCSLGTRRRRPSHHGRRCHAHGGIPAGPHGSARLTRARIGPWGLERGARRSPRVLDSAGGCCPRGRVT